MRKARALQCQYGHCGTAKAPWDLSRLAHGIARVACGLALALAAISPAPARADGSDGCLEADWIAEARAFVAERDGHPGARGLRAHGQQGATGRARVPGWRRVLLTGETVAAVYVPATREILLADDLNPVTLLTRSYLVHELVHAQQFTSRVHEHVRCPGVLEATPTAPKRFTSAPGAYRRRPSFFRFWGCSRVLVATVTDRPARA